MSSEVLAAKEAEASRGRLRAVWPQKCVFVVEEILKTEQDYVTSLRQIIEVGNVGVRRKRKLYYVAPRTQRTTFRSHCVVVFVYNVD